MSLMMQFPDAALSQRWWCCQIHWCISKGKRMCKQSNIQRSEIRNNFSHTTTTKPLFFSILCYDTTRAKMLNGWITITQTGQASNSSKYLFIFLSNIHVVYNIPLNQQSSTLELFPNWNYIQRTLFNAWLDLILHA